MDGEQLDKTLQAQREQLDRTLAEQRTRTLNERFDTVAEHLGSDKPPAVRVAGVYAMAGLADDWPEHRQMCVEVLCAYLRMPYEPEPGGDAPVEKRLAFQASREVRHTVIRVIAAHLNGTAPVSWCGLNFDFRGRFRRRRLQRRQVLRRDGQLRRCRVLRRDGQLRRRRVLRRDGQVRRCQVLRGEGQLLPRQVLRGAGRLRR